MKQHLACVAGFLVALLTVSCGDPASPRSLVEIDALEGVEVTRLVRNDRHWILIRLQKENALLSRMPEWTVRLILQDQSEHLVGRIPLDAFRGMVADEGEPACYHVSFDLSNDLLENSYLDFRPWGEYNVDIVNLNDVAELPREDNRANKSQQ